MKISILLPYKENYSPQYAGAVSLFVNDITKISSFNKDILIFGNTQSKKKLSKNYINLELNKKIFQSTSKIYVETFLKAQEKLNTELIEVHNRPNYIKIIKQKYNKNVKISEFVITTKNYVITNLINIINYVLFRVKNAKFLSHKLLSIFLHASTSASTAFTDLSNITCSSFVRIIGTTFSTPLAPIITGTPT